MKKALSSPWIENDRQRLLSIFDCFGMRCMPQKHKLRDQLVSLATTELLDKPAPLLSYMHQAISIFSDYLSFNQKYYID